MLNWGSMILRRQLAICALTAFLPAQETTPTFRTGVEIVTLSFSVTAPDGNFVHGLKKEDFILFENGKQIPIGQFWQDTDLPLTVALVADVSGSQRAVVQKHKRSMGQFLKQVLGAEDKALLAVIDSQVRLAEDFTNSKVALQGTVDKLLVQRIPTSRLGDPCVSERPRATRSRYPCGGSVIWNGVFYTARLKMKQPEGRKAMVLLTDGEDSGSNHSLTTAIEAAQGADTIVFPIQEPANGHRISAKSRKRLSRLALETGGILFDGTKQTPPQIFDQIEKELRSQYVLAFTPPERSRDGKFHKLELKIKQPGMKVRSRSGYYAPNH